MNTPLPMASNDDDDRRLMRELAPLFSIAFLLYIFRISARIAQIYPKWRSFDAADYTITFAIIANAVSIWFTATAVQKGFGKHTPAIPNGIAGLITISNDLLAAWMSGVAVSGFARISIAFMCLRIVSAPWQRFLFWAIIALQISFFISCEIVQLVQCREMINSQSRISETKCPDRTQVLVFSCISVTVCTLGDCICTIIPIYIVCGLSRSKLEKTLIAFLLALPLCATACVVPKIIFYTTYKWETIDPMWELIPEFIWWRIEEQLITIAACVPSLKGPVEGILQWLGFETFFGLARDLDSVRLSGRAEVIRGGEVLYYTSSEHSSSGSVANICGDAGMGGDRASVRFREKTAARPEISRPPSVHIRAAASNV